MRTSLKASQRIVAYLLMSSIAVAMPVCNGMRIMNAPDPAPCGDSASCPNIVGGNTPANENNCKAGERVESENVAQPECGDASSESRYCGPVPENDALVCTKTFKCKWEVIDPDDDEFSAYHCVKGAAKLDAQGNQLVSKIRPNADQSCQEEGT